MRRRLFVAIRGDRHDGHSFVPELIERGIRAFLVEELPACGTATSSFILVKDSLEALQGLAAAHRSRHNCRVIGITGSNGKTIVKEWINQALSPDQKIVRSPKSYNSQIGVPLSVLLLDQHAETGVFEAGISLPGEMVKLEAIIRPSIGIFTNIGEAHQEGFLDVAEKLEQKLILFKNASKIIYCSDQEAVHSIIRRRYSAGKLFAWSFGKESEVRVSRKEETAEGTLLDITYGDIRLELLIPFRDKGFHRECHARCFPDVPTRNATAGDPVTHRRPDPCGHEARDGERHCMDVPSSMIPIIPILIPCPSHLITLTSSVSIRSKH